MVKLNKIYTRSGDEGQTGLGDGRRVSKSDLRVAAYGAVDEANASIGAAVVVCARGGGDGERVAALLRSIQHDLFDLGADLCIPVAEGEAKGKALRITSGQTERLETEIDRANERLGPLTSFVLPGGCEAAAALHVARTVVRRAERDAVALRATDGLAMNGEVVRYLNRLSDLLFVLARLANDEGTSDVLWEPAKNRCNDAGTGG